MGHFARTFIEAWPSGKRYHAIDPTHVRSFGEISAWPWLSQKPQFTFHHGFDTSVIDTIPNRSVDFVYIDAEHTCKGQPPASATSACAAHVQRRPVPCLALRCRLTAVLHSISRCAAHVRSSPHARRRPRVRARPRACAAGRTLPSRDPRDATPKNTRGGRPGGPHPRVRRCEDRRLGVTVMIRQT